MRPDIGIAILLLAAVPMHAAILQETRCTLNTVKETVKYFAGTSQSTPIYTVATETAEYVALFNGIPNTGTALTTISGSSLQSTELLLRHAQYNAMTYCGVSPAANMSGVLAGNMFLLVGTFDQARVGVVGDLGYRVFLNRAHASIVLAFRGTSNTENMIRDMDKALVPADLATLYPGLSYASATVPRAHKGFQAATLELQRRDGGYIRALQEVYKIAPGLDLIITGHSLGGAIALNAAANLALTANATGLPVPRALFTYGQPEVGEGAFGDALARAVGTDRYVRVVSSNDVVPHMLDDPDDDVRHARDIPEVWFPSATQPTIQVCTGKANPSCSSGSKCSDRSWSNHSWYGGFWAGRRFCLLSRDPEDLSKKSGASAPSTPPLPPLLGLGITMAVASVYL
jgi:hypothetical protein